MKKIVFILFFLVANIVGLFVQTNSTRAEDGCNDHIVISQIYGGGGNSGAPYKNDFIELYNPTDKNISLENWSLQYVSATGSFPATSTASTVRSTLLHENIKAKTYYLIQENSNSDEGQPLEAPDATGLINLAADKGKIALVSSTILINSESDPFITDFVGYGSAANKYEGDTPAPSPNSAQSIIRHQLCLDSNNNGNDFKKTEPSPRNSSITEDDDEESPDDDDPPYIPDSCAALSQDIKLNEIFPYPNAGEEFVELVNAGEGCVDISGWKIMDEAGHKKEFPANSILDPGEYLFLEGNLYLNNDSDTAYLLGKDGNAKEDALDSRNFEKAQKGFSYSFDGEGWQWTSIPTPGGGNVIAVSAPDEEKSDTNSGENYSSAENVYLNEILPNPKKDSDDEYIEIVNGDSGPVDLHGWMIRDASKSGKYVFKEHTEIGPGEYLAIYKSESKIALNNSKESVYLYNPRGEITSSASYEKSQKDASLNFDGKNWKWSKYLTPGKKNKFDSEPSVKIKKIKQTYKDIYTEFSAKAKDKETKKLKFSWDFGDGKRSSLQKTSHKYLDTGKYTVTLSVSDASQTVEKSFALAVKNYPRPDLEITKILPNPVGNDSDGETIDVKNNSGKKVDIQDWKIASGSGDKIYNHPISGEISLGPNETMTITREFSKFSLNNQAGKVQLVMPDGKVIDEVEYAKEKIEEGEAYAKINGGWQWITSAPRENVIENGKPSEEEGLNIVPNEETSSDAGEVLGATDENQTDSAPKLTLYTSEDEFIFLKIFGLLEYQPREANFCPAIQPANALAYF